MKKELYENVIKEQKSQNNIRVNVFLTKEQKRKLDETKYKYRLSYSTIANIVLNEYCTIRLFDDIIHGQNLYNTNNNKTSIKLYGNKEEEWKTAKAINNALIIYLDRLDKQLIEQNKNFNEKQKQKLYEKTRQQIAEQFQNTTDPDWDYHTYVRYHWRYEKNMQR